MTTKSRCKRIKTVSLNWFQIIKCLTLVFLQVIFLTGHAPVVASVSLPFDESMAQIEFELDQFNRSKAYDQMKKLNEMLNSDKTSNLYLKNLSLMIKIEKSYKLFDDMVRHASELYDLTEDTSNSKYRLVAIDALGYYDYFNYNNSKAADMLGQMSNYSNGQQSFQYKLGLALLEIDQKNYERAFTLYDEALAISDIKEDKINQYFNEFAMVHKNIAGIYFDEKKYEEAIRENQIALKLINPLDYDYIIDLKLSLANFYYANAKYDETQQYIDEINRDYEKTSTLFKDILPKDSIQRLEANLLYNTGNYKRAAEIYYELNKFKKDSSALEENLAANDAMLKFEKSQTNKQLSLLEKLALEQAGKNKVQNKYLFAAYATIILLLILVAFAIWNLIFYKKQRKKLYDLSITDQLTQMYNRRKIVEEFDQIKLGTKCIAFMDIDHFKSINDNFGHAVGDEVLKKIAETIKTSLRIQDHVGRYGGEEFLAILDTEDMNLAVEIAERVRMNVENISWKYPDLKATISIGLVKANQLGDELLVEADELLYQSKAYGRNRLSYR